MRKFKGMLHVHSTYSYDGHHSLDEIVQYAKKWGLHFVAMSEHSDTLNQEKLNEYAKECRRVSTPDCLIIPGIEFSCENDLHLVGLGVHCYTDLQDPVKVAKFIRDQNGIAIIAHPIRYKYRIPSDLEKHVDGIEIWNASYDGPYIPNPLSLDLIRRYRKENEKLVAFGGMDLHRILFAPVVTTLFCSNLGENELIDALREQSCSIESKKSFFVLNTRKEVSRFYLFSIRCVRVFYIASKLICRVISGANLKNLTWLFSRRATT